MDHHLSCAYPNTRTRRRTPRRKTTWLNFAAAIALFLAGAALIAYPSVSDMLAQQQRDKVLEAQTQTVEQVRREQPSALAEQLEAARAYNERLAQGLTVVTDPFDVDEATASDREYLDALDLAGDGVMATIVIPAIAAELPIYHTVSDEVLQKGVGHMPGTALPVGGPSTHSVLAGHTGLPSTRIFDSLDQLVIGDYFFIEVMGETLAYQVDDIEVVLPDQTDSLAVVEDEDLVTLVTCTPYGVNSHRLLVRGSRTALPEGLLDSDGTLSDAAVQSVEQRTSPEILKNSLLGVAIGVGAAALGATVAWALSHFGRRRCRHRAHYISRYDYSLAFEPATSLRTNMSAGTHFAPAKDTIQRAARHPSQKSRRPDARK